MNASRKSMQHGIVKAMSESKDPEWDPFSQDAGPDQIERYDELRRRCPVAHSQALGWSLFRHDDVMRALDDPGKFSNVVSVHKSVPNGMDPPEHTAYRRIIEAFFEPERMRAIEPRLRSIAVTLIERMVAGNEIEVMSQVADDFALQSQCAFLGWPADVHAPLRNWVRNNHAAIRSRDRSAIGAVATQFDSHIRAVLESRRSSGDAAADDVTSQLLRESVAGRPLTDDEIVSILRNWTVGELGTIAASIGILMHYLAQHPELQEQLREHPVDLAAAIDEILRIDAPLMTSRRRTSAPVTVRGQTLQVDERVSIMWGAANRDENVFADADQFRLDRDPRLNLLYGAGIHVCPGAPLARLELRVFVEEVLSRVRLAPSTRSKPVRARYPAGGFESLPMAIFKRDRT
jgi:cytochrome P450